jgi:hypothetical protein
MQKSKVCRDQKPCDRFKRNYRFKSKRRFWLFYAIARVCYDFGFIKFCEAKWTIFTRRGEAVIIYPNKAGAFFAIFRRARKTIGKTMCCIETSRALL